MPRAKWKRPKNAGQLFLTRDINGKMKLDTEGKHPKCKKCLLVETCKNVQYNAQGADFWCADNPNERERDG